MAASTGRPLGGAMTRLALCRVVLFADQRPSAASEYPVQGDRQLDDTEIWPHVSAGGRVLKHFDRP